MNPNQNNPHKQQPQPGRENQQPNKQPGQPNRENQQRKDKDKDKGRM